MSNQSNLAPLATHSTPSRKTAIGSDPIDIRVPHESDSIRLHGLIARCPPLDVNSVYAYHLVVRHFAQTTRLAWAGPELIGATTGYRLPEEPDTLFVWQVAVDADHRGRGVAAALLRTLLVDLRTAGVRRVTATVSPDNASSLALFRATAAAFGADPPSLTPFLPAESLGPGHAPEHRLDFGPLLHEPITKETFS